MVQTNGTVWHFPVMIFASFVLFYCVIWAVMGTLEFKQKLRSILLLSLLCVIVGMLFGKYGANLGLKWWIYYPLPMLMNVFLPPIMLKMNTKRAITYLVLSFLSAPLIHLFFSFFLNWTEYMPFWKLPYIGTLIS